MWPQLFSLGPFGFNAYGVLVAFGALAGLFALQRTAPLVGWSKKAAGDLGFWLIVSGLVGARLFYVLFHWPEFQRRPLAILEYWRGGLMFQGGVVAAGLFAFYRLRAESQRFLAFADAVAPPLAFGQSLGRLGCHAAGCCYGRPVTDFPLAAVFPPGGPAPFGFPLYPTQLGEAMGLFALFLALFFSLKKYPPPGRVFGFYLFGAGSLRAFMEQFRGDDRGPEFWGQAPTFWLAALAAVFGLWLFGRTFRNKTQLAL
jgi:phosphatidylglycerol:prolipoprotein diacylglycerol transferase